MSGIANTLFEGGDRISEDPQSFSPMSTTIERLSSDIIQTKPRHDALERRKIIGSMETARHSPTDSATTTQEAFSSTERQSISSDPSIFQTSPEETGSEQQLGKDSQNPNTVSNPNGNIPDNQTDNQTLEVLQQSGDMENIEPNSMQCRRLRLGPHQLMLLGYASLFALIIGALELLNYFSLRNQGLSTVDQSWHYLWTYGPTFFLTVVVVCWGPVEYRFKQMAPWMMIRSGSSEAFQGISLNYTTASMPSVLFKSVKMGHFSVTLAISGMLLLRLLVIASTGLLSLEYRSIEQPGSFVLLDKFDFTKENGIPNSRGALRFWAIKRFNSSYPVGTTPDFATQTFSPLESVNNATLSVVADVFSANLGKCESVDWDYSAPFNITSPDPYYPDAGNTCIATNIRSPSCSIQNHCLWSDKSFWGNFSNQIEQIRCTENSTTGGSERVFIYLAWINYQELFEAGHPRQIYSGLSNIFGILCEPEYSLTRRWVSNSTSRADDLVHASEITASSVFRAAETSTTTKGIVEAMSGPQIDYGDIASYWNDDSSPWFNLLNITDPHVDIGAFNDTKLLYRNSREIFPTFAAQWAKASRMSAQNQSVQGLVRRTESRLCVQAFALRLVEALCGIFCVLGVGLSFYPTLSRNESSEGLLYHAIHLARSEKFVQALRRQESLTAYCKKRRWIKFWSKPETMPVSDTVVLRLKPDTEISTRPSWCPIPSSRLFCLSMVAISLLIAATLELLLQLSAKKHGIANVSTNGYMKYSWVFIPSLVLSLVGSGFDMLSFSTRALHKFQQLHRNPVGIKTMLLDPLSKTTIALFIQSLKVRSFGLSAIMAASMATSLLGITSSGIYVADRVPFREKMNLVLHDWFTYQAHDPGMVVGETWNKTSGYKIVTGGQDVTISDLISYDNISFPQWTYEGLAFPKISLSASESIRHSRLILSTKIPALRAQMNCSINSFHNDTTPFDESHQAYLKPSLPCVPRYSNGTIQTAAVWIDSSPWVWNRTMNNSFFASSTWPVDRSGGAKDIEPCGDSHLWYAMGRRTENSVYNVTLIACSPYAEVLDVNANFILPEFQIDTSDPPQAVEGSAQVIQKGFQGLIGWNPMSLFTGNVSFMRDIDPFFEALIWGREGTPEEELLGEENAPNLVQKMEHLWQTTLSQDLRLFFMPFPSNLSIIPKGLLLSNLTGIATDHDRLRLVQSAISTRILEGILVSLAACAIVSWILTEPLDMKAEDVGSIGAKMKLFLDSEMLKKIPEGAERWSEEELLRSGIFDRDRFSLRWWRRSKSDGEHTELTEEDNETGQEHGPRNGADDEEEWRYGIDIITASAEKEGKIVFKTRLVAELSE